MGRHTGQHLYRVHYVSSLGLPGRESYFAESEVSAMIQHTSANPKSKILKIERES